MQLNDKKRLFGGASRAIILIALTVPFDVGAAPSPSAMTQAKELFRQAEISFSLGEFETALELYSQAYKEAPLPGFLFNIAQCYRNMGRCKPAVFHYRQYLLKLPHASNRASAQRLIKQCETQIAAETAKRDMRDDPASPSTDRKGSASSPSSTANVATAPEVVQSAPTASPWWKDPWLWGGAGLTVALLATGTATGILALSQSSQYKDPTTSVARRRELRDSGRALALTSNVTFGLAAATAIGTALYWWLKPSTARSTTISALSNGRISALVVAGTF